MGAGEGGIVQKMRYTASLEDDGEDVVCTAVQADLYSGSIQSRMGVSAAAEPGPAIPVGAIIGIVLGVLFLLFLCAALLLLFLCWDRIKYKKKVSKKGGRGGASSLYVLFLSMKPKQKPVWSRKPSVSSEQKKIHPGDIVSEPVTHEVGIMTDSAHYKAA